MRSAYQKVMIGKSLLCPGLEKIVKFQISGASLKRLIIGLNKKPCTEKDSSFLLLRHFVNAFFVVSLSFHFGGVWIHKYTKDMNRLTASLLAHKTDKPPRQLCSHLRQKPLLVIIKTAEDGFSF